MNNAFSFARLIALLRKETIQILRDKLTLRIIILVPMIQLFLFGYAINSDPKHLPAGLLSIEHSKYTRAIAAALTNSGYYDIRILRSEKEAEDGLARGELMFVIAMPPDFDRAVDRGEQPSVLIDADATDPTAIGNAVAALEHVVADLNRDLPPIRQIAPQKPPFQFVLHARYNPEQLTVLNIVPGLICIVLLFSTLFVTTMAITRERERGTMENLLAMPVRPIEVMIAKIAPYIDHRLHPGLADPGRGVAVLRPADPRLGAAPARRARLLHRRQPGARGDVLDHLGQPDAGGRSSPSSP